MNKLFLACIAILALTASARPHSKIEDTRTVLAEMDKEPFGNAMISAVALNMAAQNSLDEINLILQKILSEVESNIDAADRLNKTRQEQCDTEITSLKNTIADLLKAIDSIQTAITENTNVLNNAKNQLVQAKTDLAETINQINEGTARRNKEHAEWIERDHQKSVDIAVLEEGVTLIEHMIHGVAFSQIKGRYDKVLSQLNESGKKHTLYKPLIAALTEMATKLNYENVMAILALLKNIRQDTAELQKKEYDDEVQSVEKWAKLLNTLLETKRELIAKIAQLEAQIEAVTKELENLRTSLEQNETNLENTRQTLASKEAQCATWSEEYAKLKYSEGRKRDILNKLIQHLEEKSTAFESYVRDRAAGAA